MYEIDDLFRDSVIFEDFLDDGKKKSDSHSQSSDSDSSSSSSGYDYDSSSSVILLHRRLIADISTRRSLKG